MQVKKSFATRLSDLRSSAPDWWAERWEWMRDSVSGGAESIGSYIQDWRTGKHRERLGFLRKPGFYAAVLAGFLLLYGNFYLVQNRVAYAAYYQGKEIGLVASRRQGQEIMASVQKELENRLGQRVYLPSPLTFRACTASRVSLDSPGQLHSAFFGLPWLTEGVEVVIAGRPAFLLPNREAAQRVLNRLKDEYRKKLAGEKIEAIEFSEKISFRSRPVAVGEISREEDALSLLKQGRVQTRKYRVKEGDSLWSIARAHGLLVKELLDANPNLTERLDIDQEINLAAVQPLLHVRITSSAVKREAIPFDVQVRLDSKLRRGSAKVVRDGEEGQKEVVYRFVRENDRIVSQQVLASRVLKEPVPKIVAQGTAGGRLYAFSRGSGSGVLSWPVGGGITSGYGYRGGEFHSGIDIAAGAGVAVHAAAGGRVVEAGWGGGYGRTVVIDHGNGLATRYAHLSRVDVSTGETVSKGEVIGAVGSSGRATGPHLHFEVMSNGGSVNPLNYLR
ncbi:MAG TPA: M23 family metallopeptidase [Syntrophomonadaceae bacterium]|nr:M23 family metallopeptidase [Syntrophomonadaceae bacterium]